MPKKPYLDRGCDRWIAIYHHENEIRTREYFTANSAVKGYRELRASYGDSVCLTKVVINYGEEI